MELLELTWSYFWKLPFVLSLIGLYVLYEGSFDSESWKLLWIFTGIGFAFSFLNALKDTL